jgi:CDGSH-type Zn-finger protein
VRTLPVGNYAWCACGRSGRQPWCNGSHEVLEDGTRPHLFSINEPTKVALCMCKLTKNPPFCDGSHMALHPQERHDDGASEEEAEQESHQEEGGEEAEGPTQETARRGAGTITAALPEEASCDDSPAEDAKVQAPDGGGDGQDDDGAAKSDSRG